MTAYSKALVIFILFVALLLENEAHRCGCHHKKTHKKCEEEEATTATTVAPSASTTPKRCDPLTCNNVTEPFCSCGQGIPYPLPESGNCDDVLKSLSTTPDFSRYRSAPGCSKVKTVCYCPESNEECVCFQADV